VEDIGAIFDANGLDSDAAMMRAALLRAANSEIEVKHVCHVVWGDRGRRCCLLD
jgi:hypothetical protein